MEFHEYEKMGDSLERYESTKELLSVEWAVTEKIHGANFSFHTNGEDVKVARRRDFLKDENFYNHRTASFMKECPEKVKSLFSIVEEMVGDRLIQITVYGELFGGKYDHPDVIANRQGRKTRPVQGEIQYCPDIQFCAFDISYIRFREEGAKEEEEDCDESKHIYLDFEKSLQLFDQLEIPFIKPLFIGKANLALNYELGFESYVPMQLGLPALPPGNKAEGVVIRPMKELVCKTTKNHMERVMVKLKIPEFDERRDQKGKVVQERCNQQKTHCNKGKKGKSVGRPDKVLLPRLVSMVTENRLVSAISKIGFPDTEDMEKLVEEEMFQDILTDTFEDSAENETLWDSLDKNRKETVGKSVRAKINAQIKRHKQRRQEECAEAS